MNRNCRAQGFNGAPFDLDLLLSQPTLSLPKMAERVDNLIEKMKSIETDLEGKNIEAKQGNLADKRFVWDYLQRRDMTINEVIAVPVSNETWKISYTDKCQRDIINGTGIPAYNGRGTVRWDYGRMIASPRGIIRLLQPLVESKVESIYLPQYWIERNNEEARRLDKENLGTYGLILCERYLKKPLLQLKLMRILNALGITDIEKFPDFYYEQKNCFELWKGNGKFCYNPHMSFLEVQKRLIEQKKQGKLLGKERREKKEKCPHKKTETIQCNQCGWECKIQRCLDCSAIEATPEDSTTPVDIRYLLCNRNFANAEYYWDKQGFIYSDIRQ